MNIFEIAEKFDVSLRTLRRLEKGGVLRCKPRDPILDALQYSLAKGNALSVAQLAALIDNPDWLLDLGRYAGAAEIQLEGVGKPREEAAPRSVTLHLEDAARGDPAAAAKIGTWIVGMLPEHPVNYAYVGSRLFYGVPETQRKSAIGRIGKAVTAAKRHAPLIDCWRMIGRANNQRTEFFKPKPLDL